MVVENGVEGQNGAIDWDREIDNLLSVILKTYERLRRIAIFGNLEVGGKISAILEWQTQKAIQIVKEYRPSSRYSDGSYQVQQGHSVVLGEDDLIIRKVLGILGITSPQPEGSHPGQDQGGYGSRFKRQSSSAGEATYNKLGSSFAQTPDKIASEQAKLSPAAQAEMNTAMTDGLKECKQRECRSQLKVLESGRQG